jgi:hypothetical protein
MLFHKFNTPRYEKQAPFQNEKCFFKNGMLLKFQAALEGAAENVILLNL